MLSSATSRAGASPVWILETRWVPRKDSGRIQNRVNLCSQKFIERFVVLHGREYVVGIDVLSNRISELICLELSSRNVDKRGVSKIRIWKPRVLKEMSLSLLAKSVRDGAAMCLRPFSALVTRLNQTSNQLRATPTRRSGFSEAGRSNHWRKHGRWKLYRFDQSVF